MQIYYQSTGKLLNEQFAKNLELLTEENQYNYVAYLLNDVNGISIKVAKYSGVNQVDLIENEEYGYESLIKATNQVLDKLNLENRTLTKITSKERQEKRLWDSIALREAVINAFVHNDYTREIAPKFEIFRDRLVITSYGGLPEGLSQEELFTGYSVPRNRELMRIYKDLELVEQLGSGVPRILQTYTRDYFKFSDNFLQIILPAEEVTEQVTEQVEKLLKVFEGTHYREELQQKLNLIHRENFRKMYLQPAIAQGLVALTILDKPTSSKQQYYLTEKGKAVLLKIKNK
ncbi:hypothetical protein AB406_0218 [Riemerella anatipestifer]|uniref:Filamentation induced by cAMP protein Fic-like C-terminal domain-containing protein n=1 Tax=Riemerella anatipestifer TaxID=34085 RepID=A0A1S7DPY6_RIEAN|nr:hypothetical protein AB406_0218 [Riemerella anatipestifer]